MGRQACQSRIQLKCVETCNWTQRLLSKDFIHHSSSKSIILILHQDKKWAKEGCFCSKIIWTSIYLPNIGIHSQQLTSTIRPLQTVNRSLLIRCLQEKLKFIQTISMFKWFLLCMTSVILHLIVQTCQSLIKSFLWSKLQLVSKCQLQQQHQINEANPTLKMRMSKRLASFKTTGKRRPKTQRTTSINSERTLMHKSRI